MWQSIRVDLETWFDVVVVGHLFEFGFEVVLREESLKLLFANKSGYEKPLDIR